VTSVLEALLVEVTSVLVALVEVALVQLALVGVAWLVLAEALLSLVALALLDPPEGRLLSVWLELTEASGSGKISSVTTWPLHAPARVATPKMAGMVANQTQILMDEDRTAERGRVKQTAIDPRGCGAGSLDPR
jgi:hypothetical protein